MNRTSKSLILTFVIIVILLSTRITANAYRQRWRNRNLAAMFGPLSDEAINRNDEHPPDLATLIQHLQMRKDRYKSTVDDYHIEWQQ